MTRPLTPLSEAELASLDRMTAEELLALALSHGMIDEGEMRGDRVYVRMGRETFDFSRQHGEFFLAAVIRVSHRLTGPG